MNKMEKITDHLLNKINPWLETIMDPVLREKVRSASFVSGGAIASLLMGEVPNDYDVYLDNKEVLDLLIDYYNRVDDNLEYISDNAITLAGREIQIITRFWGTPKEVHKTFDFIHCTNYWVAHSNKLVLNEQAVSATYGKELFYIGSRYPVATIGRIAKFAKRGWHIDFDSILRLAQQLSKLDLDDPIILDKQIKGMYS
jgi:hypothetical protein